MSELTSCLELAAEIARAHERHPVGTVTVIPVVVDDLANAAPPLRAMCEVAGGRYFHAQEDDLQGPIPITDDVVRRVAVETAFGAAPPGFRTVRLAGAGDGYSDAEFIDPPTGLDPSPGERTVLGVVRAAVHKSLDEHELVVIAYQGTVVDLPFQRHLWDLGVVQLSGLANPVLRTLVIVCEGRVDIGLHCRTGLGFRLGVEDGRLIKRHRADDLAAWAQTIAGGTRPLVMFLGAGFSASSKLPLGNSLRDAAIRNLLGFDLISSPGSEELARRFYRWIAEKSGWLTADETRMGEEDYVRSLTLEQVIRAEKKQNPGGDVVRTLQEFRARHDEVITHPGIAPVSLGRSLGALRGRVVIATVNFDQLAERNSTVPVRVFASSEEFKEAAGYLEQYLAGSETDVPVLKLHGTIDRPETCIVSAEQTEVGLDGGKVRAIRVLLDEDKPLQWFFVGASMRDRDLWQVFNDTDFSRGADEYWVTPYLVESVEDYARAKEPFWRMRGRPSIDDRLISETADAFFQELTRRSLGPAEVALPVDPISADLRDNRSTIGPQEGERL